MGQAETKVIRTESGILELVPATADQLRGIAQYWPMELLAYEDGSPDFGPVFQHGDEEVYGIKMQFPDMPKADAHVFHRLCRNWIASALPRYLQTHNKGVMVPCAYLKEKSLGMAEAGLAFFVGPAPKGTTLNGNREEPSWDQKLGAGATSMVWDMVNALGEPDPARRGEASRPVGKQFGVIGMDMRPRLKIGALGMHFVIEGENVIVVKYPLDENEPVWSCVVRAGFRTLPYASMVPAGFAGAPPADLQHR